MSARRANDAGGDAQIADGLWQREADREGDPADEFDWPESEFPLFGPRPDPAMVGVRIVRAYGALLGDACLSPSAADAELFTALGLDATGATRHQLLQRLPPGIYLVEPVDAAGRRCRGAFVATGYGPLAPGGAAEVLVRQLMPDAALVALDRLLEAGARLVGASCVRGRWPTLEVALPVAQLAALGGPVVRGGWQLVGWEPGSRGQTVRLRWSNG